LKKTREDFLADAAGKKVRSMNPAQLANYLYAVYLDGYTAGTSDRLDFNLKRAAARPGPSETRGE